MILPISFRLARNSLKSHRMRTFLTTLGVMIGAFVISLVLIVSAGLHAGIRNQIANFDNDLIIVRSRQNDVTGMENFSPLKISGVAILTERDADDIAKLAGVEKSAAMMFLNGSARSDKTEFDNISIVATSASLFDIMNLSTTSGGWFDDNSNRNQVVLGEKLAWSLLGDIEFINRTVTIKSQKFTVVGIIKNLSQPISAAGIDIDRTAFISMTNGMKFTGGIAQIGQILVQPESTEDDIIQKISAALSKNHVDPNEFVIAQASEMSVIMADWLQTVTIAALIFAGISLVVGGIGIMNIMLVSVVERTREIGIRKAVGATKRQICEQFLLEALLMSAGGSILGLVFAYGAGYLIGLQFSLPLAFDWWIFAIGLGVPIAIGLSFGLAPAIRAANRNPIAALRQYH